MRLGPEPPTRRGHGQREGAVTVAVHEPHRTVAEPAEHRQVGRSVRVGIPDRHRDDSLGQGRHRRGDEPAAPVAQIREHVHHSDNGDHVLGAVPIHVGHREPVNPLRGQRDGGGVGEEHGHPQLVVRDHGEIEPAVAIEVGGPHLVGAAPLVQRRAELDVTEAEAGPGERRRVHEYGHGRRVLVPGREVEQAVAIEIGGGHAPAPRPCRHCHTRQEEPGMRAVGAEHRNVLSWRSAVVTSSQPSPFTSAIARPRGDAPVV